MGQPRAYGQKIRYAVLNETTAASNEIVAAVSGAKIVVTGYTIVCGAAETVTWQSSGSSDTAISGDMQFAANGGISAPYHPDGHFETATGEALDLLQAGAADVSGHVTYFVEVQ